VGAHQTFCRKNVKHPLAYKIAAVLLIPTLFIATLYCWHRSIVIKAEERERHFISIYFLAIEDESERGSDRTANFETLVSPWGGTSGALARPFRHGLEYHVADGLFVIQEPQPQRVSIFKKDRLVASGLKRPYWEATGKLATKRN
jgi:hypothetical protein